MIWNLECTAQHRLYDSHDHHDSQLSYDCYDSQLPLIFIWDEIWILATASSIRRALTVTGWSKKSIHQRAKEQNAELQELYLRNVSEFESYHLVYVDESGCDKRIGFRLSRSVSLHCSHNVQLLQPQSITQEIQWTIDSCR